MPHGTYLSQDFQERYKPEYQHRTHHNRTIFRAKGVVAKTTRIQSDKNKDKYYYIASVNIGDYTYDIPVHSGIKENDIIELIVNGVKINHFNNGAINGNR